MRKTPARIRSGALALATLLAFSAQQALAQASGGAAANQASQGQAAAQLELIPAKGPVAENIRVVAAGLPANAKAVVLGGTDPQKLAPLAEENADAEGNFRAMVSVPDTAQYGSDFYFALKIGDAIIGPAAYRVEARKPDPA
jgi:membrane-associated protease RseP (regulator of RpoE activity)